jgi:3-isopropylmalate/(R)-2-methylmalate dehydratase large subunit
MTITGRLKNGIFFLALALHVYGKVKMSQGYVQEVIARATGGNADRIEDHVKASIDLAAMHESCVHVARAMDDLECTSIWDPSKVVVALDHWVPPPDMEASRRHSIIREFIKKFNIRYFHDIGRNGIIHHVLLESNYVAAGDLVVITDSHAAAIGAAGAIGIGIGPTDMVSAIIEGEIWLKVPDSWGVSCNGTIEYPLNGKDVALWLLREIGQGGAEYKALEFSKEFWEITPIAHRLPIAVMMAETGAKTSVFIPGDHEQEYDLEKTIHIDLDGMESMVAVPPRPDNVRPVSDMGDISVDQVFIGSCTNGGFADLEVAASILRGKRIHKDTRLIVSPSTQMVYLKALRRGTMEILIRAGATITAPGCAACFGSHGGLLAPGETCISTTNRNFPGRMGSNKASIYLVSPETAASSALKGKLTDPREI